MLGLSNPSSSVQMVALGLGEGAGPYLRLPRAPWLGPLHLCVLPRPKQGNPSASLHSAFWAAAFVEAVCLAPSQLCISFLFAQVRAQACLLTLHLHLSGLGPYLGKEE